MTIGNRIREARRALDLTQQHLADELGVDQSTVSGWESDPARRPSRDLMPALSVALKRTVEWLEGRPGAEDRNRDFDFGDARAPRRGAGRASIAAGEHLDENLLREIIKMTLSSMVAPYGVSIPDRRFEDAATACAATYASQLRLKTDDAA